MKRKQAIRALANYFKSVDVEYENDLNEFFAEKAIDFLYELNIMRPVDIEYKSSGCLHSMWESCNCGSGETIVKTEWEK